MREGKGERKWRGGRTEGGKPVLPIKDRFGAPRD